MNIKPSNSVKKEDILELIEIATQKASEISGHFETIQINPNIEFKDDNETLWIGNFSKPLTTLFIFTHIGITIPLKPKYLSQYNIPSKEDFTYALYANRDAGIVPLLNKLSERLETEESKGNNLGIMVYKYNRNLADANRIRPEEQIYDNPYKGISLWKKGVNKNILHKELVDPFFQKIIKTVKELKPKFIFHPHTYDTYSGEGAKTHTHDKHSGKRPTGMVFNKYQFETEAYGIYGTENESCDFNFLTQQQIELIQQIQNKHIAKIPGLDETPNCTIDFPYVSPRQLPGAINKFYKVPQLIIEYRKDLFQNGLEQIVDSVLEIAKSVLR